MLRITLLLYLIQLTFVNPSIVTERDGHPTAISKSIIDSVIMNPENGNSIQSTSLTPDQFLQGSLYYGGKRSTLECDDLLEKATKWGISFHDYQFIKRDQDQFEEIEFIPQQSNSPLQEWKHDAFSIYSSCQTQAQSEVDNLNKQCDNQCGQTYMLMDVWGTLSGMNWKQDGILFQACGIISIMNSKECFDNFPNSCTIQSHANDFPLFSQNVFQSGEIVQFGMEGLKSKDQLIQELKSYAIQTNQNLTIPTSSSSSSSR